MNKKAVSLIVTYSLIIVISIAISVIVYNFLKLHLPSEKETCPEAVSVIINEAVCDDKMLTLNIANHGLFNISALYIRMEKSGREVKTQVNEGENVLLTPPLPPNGQITRSYNVSSIVTSEGKYAIEIQPAIVSGRKIILCENSIITEDVDCTIAP